MGKRRKAQAIFIDGELPGAAKGFATPDELLEVANRVITLRRGLASEYFEDDNKRRIAIDNEKKWTRYWHTSFNRTTTNIELCDICRRKKLNRTEREILAVLVLERLGILGDVRMPDCADIVDLLSHNNRNKINIMRCMSEEGRLFKAKLISYEDEDDDLRDRNIVVDPGLVDSLLYRKGNNAGGWPVKTESELFAYMDILTRSLYKKSDALDHLLKGYNNTTSDFYKASRKIKRLERDLRKTLRQHTDWNLTFLYTKCDLPLQYQPRTILLALLGKELGHLDADNDLFKGGGLARAISFGTADYRQSLGWLQSDSMLIEHKIIQPSGGGDSLLADDPAAIEETEFELAPRGIELFGVDKKIAKKRSGESTVREAKVSMGQLVLSEKVQSALQMAISQAKYSNVLMNDWGLRDSIAYGRAVTILFGGPPGVGKTACAEAMAHKLEKPILVADYSQIQNCYVGNTEKNIVKTFHQAKQNDAVLFWDECDAMFYDRDSASQNWEVRDVNVLLQELEKFEGVCILSTNRKISLDKALERRISMKVEFDTPDQAMRKQIWEKLIPAKMPLTKDVSLEKLGNTKLTGGEIKNAVLNAARIALCRGAKSRVTMEDFKKAVEMETGGRWSDEGCGKLGFVV